MKGLLPALIACLILVACGGKSSVPHRDEIEDLLLFQGVYHIGGWAVGAAGEPDRFYLLAQKISKEGKEEDFRTMLKDTNPAVRAMGLVCLAKNEKEYPILVGDDSKVTAFSFGCVGETMTMEQFSIRLSKDKNFRAGFVNEIGNL